MSSPTRLEVDGTVLTPDRDTINYASGNAITVTPTDTGGVTTLTFDVTGATTGTTVTGSTAVHTPIVDTVGATSLQLGPTTATSVVIGGASIASSFAGAASMAANKNFTCSAGTSALDFSLGTGVTKTTTGTFTIGGATVFGANIGVTCTAGTGAFDFSNGTGVFKTTTGLTTIGGDLLLDANKILGFGAPQALSGPGAVNVTTLVTNFTSTGVADALTLANGTQAGQLKIVHHTVDGGSGLLAPTTTGNFTSFTLTAVHDACLLQWSGTAWNIVLNVGGTII